MNGERQTKNSTADLYEIGVKKFHDDVVSDLRRPLAVEIVFPSFLVIRKTFQTSKRYRIDDICQQNTNRQQCHTVVTLSTGDLIFCLKSSLKVEIDVAL
jgi:hypothetical protein